MSIHTCIVEMYVLDTYAIMDDIVSTFAAESNESNVTVARTCVQNNKIQIICGTVSFVLATNCTDSLILFHVGLDTCINKQFCVCL